MDTKKIKILYAEDNRITAQETGEALEDNGYEVKTVFDGDEAWLAYQSSRPDVVVLDYQMPGNNRPPLRKSISAISDQPFLPCKLYP